MKEIYVTKPFLPPLNEYIQELEEIWSRGILTNGGSQLSSVSVLHGVANETKFDEDPPEGRVAESLPSSPQATITKSRQEIAAVTMFPRNDILSIFPPNYDPLNNSFFSFWR